MDKKRFLFLVLVMLTVITIGETTIIAQNNKKVLAAADASSGPHLLIIKEKEGLLQISSSRYLITGEFEHGKDALAVDYHYPANLLIWSTRKGRVYSCQLEESRLLAYVEAPRLLYAEDRWLPASLAVDHLADQLFVLDTRSNSIRVLDLSCRPGACRQTVIDVPERNFKPSLVELDPIEGFIFLMDHGEVGNKVHHILRMRMDGSQPKIIDPPSLDKDIIIGKIALDRVNKRILVSSIIQRKFFIINYNGETLNGTTQQQRLQNHETAAISMSVTRNELFWVNAFDYHSNTAYLDGKAYRCTYDPKSGCQANSTRPLAEDGIILALRAVEPASQAVVPSKLNCRSCTQFCLGSSCACETAWQLDNNEVNCQRVREFLLYEDAGVVRGTCLPASSNSKCQPIAPFSPEFKFKNGERTGFDYDPTTRKLYYGGNEAIYQTDIDTTFSNASVTRPLLHQKGVFFGPLAVDWVSKNLYYTEIEQRGNVSFYTMKVMSVRHGESKFAQASSSLLWEFGRIHTIAVHPNRGYLFISIFNNGKRRYQLLRLNTDAKNPKNLEKCENVTFVSIDYANDRLYMLTENNLEIKSSDLNGEDIRKVVDAKNLGSHVTGFLVHENLIYIQNRTSMRKFVKTSGKDVGQINLFPYDQQMSVGLKLHSIDAFRFDSALGHANPCADNNGKCQDFCFAVPYNSSTEALVKVCRCFDGSKC